MFFTFCVCIISVMHFKRMCYHYMVTVVTADSYILQCLLTGISSCQMGCCYVPLGIVMEQSECSV